MYIKLFATLCFIASTTAALAAPESAAQSCSAGTILNTSHGTLVVALATPKFIVVASDSRRTSDTGEYDDNGKKLFVIANDRIIGTAGFASQSSKQMPWFNTEIPALLDEIFSSQIYRSDMDDADWNDPPPPSNFPPKMQRIWSAEIHEFWWGLLLLIATRTPRFFVTPTKHKEARQILIGQ